MALVPQFDNQLQTETEVVELPSRTYKLNLDVVSAITKDDKKTIENTDRIIGFVDNLEAVKQAIYHILMTERYAYLIYDENYGIELEQYIGKDFNFLKSTIETTLKEALTYDLRITDVIVDSIEEINKDTARVTFSVESIYGNLQMEVNINV